MDRAERGTDERGGSATRGNCARLVPMAVGGAAPGVCSATEMMGGTSHFSQSAGHEHQLKPHRRRPCGPSICATSLGMVSYSICRMTARLQGRAAVLERRAFVLPPRPCHFPRLRRRCVNDDGGAPVTGHRSPGRGSQTCWECDDRARGARGRATARAGVGAPSAQIAAPGWTAARRGGRRRRGGEAAQRAATPSA